MVSLPSSFEIPLDAFLEDSGNLDLADTAAVRAHGLRTLPFHPELVFRLSRNAVEVSGTAEQVEKTKEIARLAGECESLYRDGNAGEVVKMAARVLDANPAYRFARVQLITSLGQLERYDDAMDALLEGLRLDPLYPLYHLHMAALLGNTDASDDLIEQYARRAKELNAPTFWPDLLLCMVALKQERYADLLALSSEALNAHPDSPELLYHHAVALDHIGRYQDAIGKFEKMMRHAKPETLLPGEYYIVDEIYLSCVQEAARENAPAVQTAVRGETARLESEFGWEVIFKHEAKGWNPDEERNLELPRKIHWMAEKPPGIVEVRLGEEHDFSCYEELRALTEVRTEAAALQANRKNNRPVRLQQAVANMANEWFVLPDDCEANPENLTIMRNIFEWGLEMPLGWLACHRQMER